jgi:hypothetical protein
MAHVPLHERALARHEEANEARESLLTSLDELRTRADRFVAVVESTATVFAALAKSPSILEGSVQKLRRLPEISSPDAEARGPSERPAVNPSALPIKGMGASLYPDALRPGTVNPESLARDACVMERVVPLAIVSANTARVEAGNTLSFTVTTTGTPVPSLTKKGALPDHVRFDDNGDGTATLSGTPDAVGDFRVTVKAKFDKGAAKYVAAQTFTLTVVAHA